MATFRSNVFFALTKFEPPHDAKMITPEMQLEVDRAVERALNIYGNRLPEAIELGPVRLRLVNVFYGFLIHRLLRMFRGYGFQVDPNALSAFGM